MSRDDNPGMVAELDHLRLGHHIPLVNLGLLKGWVEGAGQ